MKITHALLTTIVAVVLIHVAPQAYACGVDDFAIIKFEPSEKTRAGGRRVFSLAGEVQNNCATPAAPELKVDAKDASGKVIRSETGWPAGANNIEPGKTVKFEFGPLFRYDERIKFFGIAVNSTKTF